MARSRAPLWLGGILCVLALAWLLYPFAAPRVPQTTLEPLTEFARSTWRVYALVFWITLGIFILVEGLLVFAALRFQRRADAPAEELPPQTHGHTPLEIGWTAATFGIVMLIFVVSCQEVNFVQGDPPSSDPLRVEVYGRQWWWEFYYPEYDLVTANEPHLPVGRTAVFEIHATDVIHSFWVPKLGGKRDAVPGRVNRLWFTPERPGRYDGQCAEYCGTSHANMLFEVVVEDPDAFARWVERQKAPTPPPADPAVQAGQTAFLQAGCIACHTPFQNDRSVLGQRGPNLKKVATRRLIAAGLLENTPGNMRLWLRNPQHVKPGALMDIVAPQCTGPGEPEPCCRGAGIGNCLSDETIERLVAYLRSLS